jgi:hypothetical protein
VRQSPAVAAAALDDLQPFGNPLRIAPKRVVDKAFEQIRRQQACSGSTLTVPRTVCRPGVPARSSNSVTL